MTSNGGETLWNEPRRLNPSSQYKVPVIDGKSSLEDITDIFESKYEVLYNIVPTDSNALKDIRSQIESSIVYDIDANYIISVNDVKCAINLLKRGKSDGRALSSDHFIFCTNRCMVLLSLLFSCMLNHGYCPAELLKSVIIPIPKAGKDSYCKSENYRGISLCSLLCDLLEIIIQSKFGKLLNYSYLHHSTAMCVTAFKEIASYYMSHDTDVYACYLDASSAFDRINFSKLFMLLFK